MNNTVAIICSKMQNLKQMFQSAVLTAEVKYSSRKIALKTARDGEKNMTHDSVNIFFKLLLKNLL